MDSVSFVQLPENHAAIFAVIPQAGGDCGREFLTQVCFHQRVIFRFEGTQIRLIEDHRGSAPLWDTFQAAFRVDEHAANMLKPYRFAYI